MTGVRGRDHRSAGEAEAVASGGWLRTVRRYFVAIAFGNIAWETAQLPLYTIWHQGSAREIVFAVVHCTGGDLLVAGAALFGTLLVIGNKDWPFVRFRAVAAITLLIGLAYTMFSEWLNTEIRGSWAYTDFMPTLPLIGTGISPLLQWILVPMAGFWWARRPFAAAGISAQARRIVGIS
jgi:hypothetical protein